MRRQLGHFPDRLNLRLLPQRSRRLVVRYLWSRGGWSRAGAVLVCLLSWRKTRRRWRLLADFRYVRSDGVTVTVPRRTIVDGASIPCFWWRLIGPPMGDYVEASVPHDYQWGLIIALLKRGFDVEFDRVNDTFLDGMRTLGIAPWRRWVMYHAVGLNGDFQVLRYALGNKKRSA